ncbi:MAG: hypothetical protein B7733_09165 [Myxococcales bacterium FL481]|nr:MAG: hypothetical protein B7733_09165 [Myxococcales bacterium FL481]
MRTRNQPDRTRSSGVPILARSFFRQMRDQGYSSEQIIGFSSELIELVRHDMQRDLEPAE